ncbi:MAG: hypothetical protein LBR65_07525 [Culturomica sp.]|jgi:carbon monoxide dehydrogenase subunit G|nr:hypothetical protein [Culturomica sp.]
MANVKIVSQIYKINSDAAPVYSFLSDFNRIGSLMEAARQAGNAQELNALTEKLEEVRFSENECMFVVKGLGEVTIRIAEKEHPKLVKLEGGGKLPFDFNLWIQLLENGPSDTRLRITFESDMNMMLKMMLKGKLEKGIEQMAEGLAKIPYAMIG